MWVVDLHPMGNMLGLKVFYFLQKVILESSNRSVFSKLTQSQSLGDYNCYSNKNKF